MLTTVEEFQLRLKREKSTLIADLQSLTGRYGSAEADAWDRSLTAMSSAFKADSFKPLHLYFGSKGNLSLEYRLPASSSWCDVVLLGAHKRKPSAVIVELKDWMTRGDQPGDYEGLVWRQGSHELHPSDQVRGYTEYCRRFHSAVQDHSADVSGCVLFTRDEWTSAYTSEPNARLAADFPLFTLADRDDAFPDYFRKRLSEPHAEFAEAFEIGRYRQKRGFVAQIGAQILDPTSTAFELLDGQRRAFAHCRGIIGESFHRGRKKAPPKKVVIVRGPPGSGKSVIAARLWASLVTDAKLPDGDVVLTTTSTAQNRTWAWLMQEVAGTAGARGVVRKATGYTPIDTQTLGRLRRKRGPTWLKDASAWRANLQSLRAHGVPFREETQDNANLVSIVDEAHALINPESKEGRGQFGFVVTLGPQAYHIIRSSMLSVFLLDPLQGFRQRENTSIEDIRAWSRELGAGDPVEVDLAGMQFRCEGSVEYVRWVESMLGSARASDNAKLAATWRRREGRSGSKKRSETPQMQFVLHADPESWEAKLRARAELGDSVRLVSSYSRKWSTKRATQPHDLESSEMDFHERYRVNGRNRYWSRIWNHVPREDYSYFVAGRGGGRIAEDPLCEVGCPYVVRGFDFDYIGLLWLDDLVWRGDRWTVDPTKVHETGFSALTNAALREMRAGREGEKRGELLERVMQAYRILLTRALKGVHVWVPDEETREHLARSLAST